MTDKERDTVDNMARIGGGFVKALAECFYRADPINFKILKDTFSEYWKQYSKE